MRHNQVLQIPEGITWKSPGHLEFHYGSYKQAFSKKDGVEGEKGSSIEALKRDKVQRAEQWLPMGSAESAETRDWKGLIRAKKKSAYNKIFSKVSKPQSSAETRVSHSLIMYCFFPCLGCESRVWG